MIEIAALATTVISSFLLPYAQKGAEAFAEALADKAGEASAEYTTGVARRIWDRVRGTFGSDKERTTLELFASDPETYQSALLKLLTEKLERDRALVQEFSELVETPGPDGQTAVVHIQSAGLAGVVYMPGADFRQSHGVQIIGAARNIRSIPDQSHAASDPGAAKPPPKEA